MKYYLYLLCGTLLILSGACDNGDDNLIFEQTADERVAAAIADLEQKLTAPPNGWIVRYQPVPESGAYNVLLNFNEEGNVRIRTDFGVNDNEFYDQTVSYRIDNSLGLELILETYSFFSYLYEQNQATFEAEYEFDYRQETPDGALVFSSKTDLTSFTVLAFEPAPDNAESLLGRTLNADLETLSASLGVVSPVYRLDYANRDLSLFLSLNTDLRTISFTYATSLSGERGRTVDFTTSYLAQGNSLMLAEPLEGNFLGTGVTISAINFSELIDAAPLEACGEPVAIQQYRGTIAESNDPVALLPTLFDPAGAAFRNNTGVYLANPVRDIYNNGVPIGDQVRQDVNGVTDLVLFYQANRSGTFVSLGFAILTPNGEFVVPVRGFSPVYIGNQIEFNFDPTYDIVIGDTTAMLDTLAMDTYISNIAEGGDTRILQSGSNVYELYNTCTGWSTMLRKIN